jgi:hypothetical protein
MSEVDRLSNSGLFPALPMGDKRESRQGPASKEAKPGKPPPKAAEPAADAGGAERQPKSLIDEYV